MLFHYIINFLLAVLVSDAVALKLTPINSPAELTNPRTSSRTPKREASFTGDLDLQDFESFYWGAPAGNKLIYANLTVYFPEQYRSVIAMERFAGKLKSVQCEEDMVLEFTDDAAFQYAKDVWNWVNQDVNNSFIMVTNYEGCADEMERLPFAVSDMRYDEVANKAYLTADLKEWEEVAHSYTLNVGHMPLTPNHRMLMERGLVPRGPDFSMDLTSGYDKNLFSATVGGWTTSVDAEVRTVGSLNVDFDVDVSWLSIKSAAMTITPEDVAASIQLVLSEQGTLSKAYNWQDTIISIPIEGIEIAKVVKLGAFLDVDVGFSMDEWTGTAVANLGARMELSNSAIVKVDLVNSGNNAFSGWTPSFSPIPLTVSAKVEGSAKVFAEPNIKLEASALGKGWNVGLNLQMPYIKADFAAMADTTGVCDTDKTLGVDIDANIGVELTVQAATKGNEANPFWEQELYSNEWGLFSKCFAFGPENAQSGEVADPKPPASKTKSKSKTKATKTNTSQKPKPTKPPKSTEEPTPTKASSTKRSSSKISASDPTPTKATSSTKRPTTTDDITGSDTSTKPSATGGEPSGTPTLSGSGGPSSTHKGSTSSTKATATDESTSKLYTSGSSATSSSTASASDSTITLSLSSSSLNTLSWTNSSHTHSATDEAPESNTEVSSTSKNSISTSGEPTLTASSSGSNSSTPSSIGDEKPPASLPAGNSTSKPAPITTPPLTATSVASSSESSSSTEVCDISGSGCKHCKDSLDEDEPTREYFAIEADYTVPDSTTNATLALLKRATRIYKFVCGDDLYKISMAEYPTFKTYTDKPGIVTGINGFYQAADSTDCLNHKITTTAAPAAAVKPKFAAEHIYEGNWMVNFLRFLHEKEGFSCPDMKALFFTADATNNAGTTWAQALMESLGSQVNQNLLVFLRQNINGAKFRIFMDDNDMIAEEPFQADKASGKMERIATMGRAIDYMAQPQIGSIVLDTAKSVEETLNELAKAAAESDALKGKLKHLESGTKLASKHRDWLNGFMQTRNAIATDSMKRWASQASDAYETETPGLPRSTVDGTVVHGDKTLEFLQALQTAPPTGFNADKYAPLLP